MKYTNKLIYSTSPYLLQHAHNPVNWNPWSPEIIDQAKKEKKMVIVSIGYAACHWCHVMEHESFEDMTVARIMNTNFICIKVDREERPDVDRYYMSAVQLMGLQGGWPLNVVALPDGRPVWGGTYFPKEAWIKNLQAIVDFYSANADQTEKYASKLQKGLEHISLNVEPKETLSINSKLPGLAVENWKKYFDMKQGGRTGAPKFPMPVTLDFLLYYGFIKGDEKVLEHVSTTLVKMARGGIYDQIGGGFARYSVDEKWKVPHFEKMLYDNAQLISIYSKAYQKYRLEEFKTVVYDTIGFLEREMMDETGAFYSSLDADSEGEEGKFYVWDEKEVRDILPEDHELFADYYNINPKGLWENGQYILLRNVSDEQFAERHGITTNELSRKVENWKHTLLKERGNRVRPGLDDKTLISWNALAIQGLVDAYIAFKEDRFLHLALKNARFINENAMRDSGLLFHNWKAGESSVKGFLEDYANVIQSYISLFEVTGDAFWIQTAEKLNMYTLDHFFDAIKGLFYFNEKDKISIITNHYQIEDNVIPASNSVMAHNLHRLYLVLGRPQYKRMIDKMLTFTTGQFAEYPMAYSNWGRLILKLTANYYEVVVCGSNAENLVREMQTGYFPNVLWAYSDKPGDIPILKDRFEEGKDLIYICREGICGLPVGRVEEALELVQQGQ